MQVKTIQDLWHWFYSELLTTYPGGEAAAIGNEVFLNMLALPADQRILRAGEDCPQSWLSLLQDVIIKLKKRVPVQYITGKCDFLELLLSVSSDVLIPRPETQELVLWMVELLHHQRHRQLHVLDIGTGSGCIAISIKRMLPQSKVFACDISDKALEVARENARDNEADIVLFHCDILTHPPDLPLIHKNENAGAPVLFDAIISNPPYVRDSEKRWMDNNVLLYEPSMALFVGDDDPLIYHRSICEVALKQLKPDGLLGLEVNEFLAEDVVRLLAGAGFSRPLLKQDIHGKNRFVAGWR